MVATHGLLAISLAVLAGAFFSAASGAIVEYTFQVQNLTVNKLCNTRVITAVNGTLPGPIINVTEGDTLVVHVINNSPYNLTIHWHGIFQLLSGWADGPSYITQCPIPPNGGIYTYRFNVTKQQGTLWWHAHVSLLRATVYGGLIIRPKSGSYPFLKPYAEVPIILGEYWNADVVAVENEALASGFVPNNSDAYTINGRPGNLYPCSVNDMYNLTVTPGKTYLLRIINAALNNQLFFKIAGHNFTVVAADASYVTPYKTDVIVLAPGQTADALFTANQYPGAYYMATHPYISAQNVGFDNTTATGLVLYQGASSSSPVMPSLPAFNDTPTANKFYTSLTSLVVAPNWVPVAPKVDQEMFTTAGLGFTPCPTCQIPIQGLQGLRFSASMNNRSFQLPTTALLQAHYYNIPGVYTTDFPNQPPFAFNYTDPSISLSPLAITLKSTSVKKLKFNSTVQVIFQNTALVGVESHPMHLHGFNFHVLAQGFGNYNATTACNKFNYYNPQIRNTIAVPVGGWAVIRFTANNPGIWFLHCHLDVHLPWGLAMAFEVDNGGTPDSTLPPPPADLPKC
ncbi:hypothetical protein MLD38_038419 [Melastoma candidum]|uniref:Uncharacterized protein n=1 Tax=Melastoma candidum TaxID=119954 RepID=A0ACB9KZV5_9MYRT|nr:hypothetical protein MLD38_038419 [Melastoma candidum]